MRTLKKNLAAIVRSIRFISIAAALVAVTTSAQHHRDWKLEHNGLIRWSTHCDFPGGSVISHIKVPEHACSSTCLSNAKCTHFSFNGNFCFLKRFEEHILSVDKTTMIRCGFITNREVSSNDEAKLLDQLLKNDVGQTQMQHNPPAAVQKSAINPRQGTIANGHPNFNPLNTAHQTNEAKNAATFPEKPAAVVHQQNTKPLQQGAKANNGQHSSSSLNNILQGNIKNEASLSDEQLADDAQAEQQSQQRNLGLPNPNTVDDAFSNKKPPALSQASKPVLNSRTQQSGNRNLSPSLSRVLNLQDEEEVEQQQLINSDEDSSPSRLNSNNFPFGNQGPSIMNRPSLNEESPRPHGGIPAKPLPVAAPKSNNNKEWNTRKNDQVKWRPNCIFTTTNIIGLKPSHTPESCWNACLSDKQCVYFHLAAAASDCFLYKLDESNRAVDHPEPKSGSQCGFIASRLAPVLANKLNEPVNRGSTDDDDMLDDEMPDNIQQRYGEMNGDDDPLFQERNYFTVKAKPTEAPTTTKRTTRATKPTTPSPYKPGELMWSDEFKSLDTDIWKQTVTGKNGDRTFQFYSSDSNNSFIRDGILFIKPTLTVDRLDGDEDQLSNGGMINLISEGCDPATDLGQCVLSSQGLSNNEMINPIVSAQLSTEKSFNFTFGRVEIRAKMPAGDWISSGISLLPAEPYYGEGPRSGEIDIISSHGNQHMTCNSHPFGRQMASSSIHMGSSAMNFDSPLISIKLNRTVDYSADFHLYRLDWSPDGFKIFIDGQLTGEVKAPATRLCKSVAANQEEDPEKNPWLDASLMAPFDQPFYFVLDVNVGGSGFPDDCDYYPHKKPWTANDADAMRQFWDKKNQWLPTWNISKDDNAMQVDYIRIYAL